MDLDRKEQINPEPDLTPTRIIITLTKLEWKIHQLRMHVAFKTSEQHIQNLKTSFLSIVLYKKIMNVVGALAASKQLVSDNDLAWCTLECSKMILSVLTYLATMRLVELL